MRLDAYQQSEVVKSHLALKLNRQQKEEEEEEEKKSRRHIWTRLDSTACAITKFKVLRAQLYINRRYSLFYPFPSYCIALY